MMDPKGNGTTAKRISLNFFKILIKFKVRTLNPESNTTVP